MWNWKKKKEVVRTLGMTYPGQTRKDAGFSAVD
jgi:hypothetical protein